MVPIHFRELSDSSAAGEGEIVVRWRHRDDATTNALSALVLAEGLSALEAGEGPCSTIVVNSSATQPTFDEMLAAWFAQRLVAGQALPGELAPVTKYAALLLQGKTPTALPPADTIEAMFLAIRFRAGDDLCEPTVAARFLAGWDRLIARLEPALSAGVDIFRESIFTDGTEFSEERADLLADEQRYRWDVQHGERWTVRLTGNDRAESALLLCKPTSFQFPFWSRRDRQSPTGEPYALLIVDWGAGNWVISTSPALPIKLHSLAKVLQQAENGAHPKHAARTWYDGQRHEHTLIAAPHGGTKLTARQLVGTIRRWAKGKRYAPSKVSTGMVSMASLAGTALALTLAVMLASGWFRSDDSGAPLYAQVAPAVVRIETDLEQGSGFFVSPDGWLVTNKHVVGAARANPNTGVRSVRVQLGEFVDGQMQPTKELATASVYKVDAARDLALLKLDKPPTEVASLVSLPLAATNSRSLTPGSNCWVIGNPKLAAAPFNLIRPGQVGGTDTPTARQQRENGIKTSAKIVHSSCPLSAGDSGSPLIDPAGQVLGVTVAIPRVGRDTWHIHVDELRGFLAEHPAEPQRYVPTDRPEFFDYQLRDLVVDSVLETVAFGDLNEANEGFVSGFWVDLLASQPEVHVDDVNDPMRDPVASGRWKYQFAVLCQPWPTTFYDVDADGRYDVIRQGQAENNEQLLADTQWTRDGDQWQISPAPEGTPLFDDRLLSNPKMREHFKKLRPKLERQMPRHP